MGVPLEWQAKRLYIMAIFGDSAIFDKSAKFWNSDQSPAVHFWAKAINLALFKTARITREILMESKYSAMLFFVGLVPFWKEAKASMPIDCMPNIVEVRIYFGNGNPTEPSLKSRTSVFKHLAVAIRDTAKINYLRNEKWYLSGTEASLRSYKFAIVSIPDSIKCPLSKPDTTYFDSECKFYENSINRAEIDPNVLEKISRLVPENKKKLLFNSKGCREKLNKSP